MVPCGKCLCCRIRRQNEWVLRLTHEVEASRTAFFVTLTYREECLSYVNEMTGEETDMPTVSVKHVRDFLKRLRIYCKRKYGVTDMKHYLAAEYGEKFHRPHYHAILFNIPAECVQEVITKEWYYGFVKVDAVKPARIRYVTKYCTKDKNTCESPDPKCLATFTSVSRRPFIGSSFVYSRYNQRRYKDNPEACVYCVSDGVKYGMPRIYLDKFLPPKSDEREIRRDIIAKNYICKANQEYAEEVYLFEHDHAGYVALMESRIQGIKEFYKRYFRNKRRRELDTRRLKTIYTE